MKLEKRDIVQCWGKKIGKDDQERQARPQAWFTGDGAPGKGKEGYHSSRQSHGLGQEQETSVGPDGIERRQDGQQR